MKSSPRPSLIGWTLSLIAASASVAVWLGSAVVFQSYREVALMRRLEVLGKGDVVTVVETAVSGEQDSLVQRLLHPGPELELMRGILVLDRDPLFPTGVSALINGRARLLQGAYGEALGHLRRAHEEDPEVTLDEITTRMRTIVEEASALNRATPTPEEQSDRSVVQQLSKQYDAVQYELIGLLGLGPPERSEEKADAENVLKFYESGVLEGCPILPQLSGPPSDIGELRAVLSRLGAVVQVTGENPVEEFQTKLGTIRSMTADLKATYDGIRQRESERRAARETRRTEIENKSRELARDLETLSEGVLSSERRRLLEAPVLGMVLSGLGAA